MAMPMIITMPIIAGDIEFDGTQPKATNTAHRADQSHLKLRNQELPNFHLRCWERHRFFAL